MKIEAKPADETPKFVPFYLTFHVETLDEAGRLYALFNHSDVIEATQVGGFSESVRDAITEHNGNNCPPYREYHKALQKLIGC